MPKIPVSPTNTLSIKSPPKSQLFQATHQQLPRTGQSPPKLISNKSKNKL